MITLATNELNDIYIDGGGLLAIRRELAALAQCCETAIQAQRGEMVYAADQGMPMMATAFMDYDPQGFEAAARAILRTIPGVLEVVAFNVSRADGALRYTAVILTVYGEAPISG